MTDSNNREVGVYEPSDLEFEALLAKEEQYQRDLAEGVTVGDPDEYIDVI